MIPRVREHTLLCVDLSLVIAYQICPRQYISAIAAFK
jgi:hypothetical protein